MSLVGPNIRDGVPPPPCDTCALEEICYAKKLACQAFARYVEMERGGKHIPTREIYDNLFESVTVSPPEAGVPPTSTSSSPPRLPRVGLIFKRSRPL